MAGSLIRQSSEVGSFTCKADLEEPLLGNPWRFHRASLEVTVGAKKRTNHSFSKLGRAGSGHRV